MPRLATAKQVFKIHELMDERNLAASPKLYAAMERMSPEQVETYLKALRDQARSLDIRQASQWIDALLKLPYAIKDTPAKIAPAPEPGYYAVRLEEEGPLKFYRVRNGKPGGRWENFTFVDAQASDEFHPVKSAATRSRIYRAIEDANPAAARALYGQTIGRCGVCGRTLTDELSRALGIGPVCREG